MTGAAKRKGDKAELEAAALLTDLFGYPIRRKLGAGRLDDEGDLEGLPDTVVQVCSRTSEVVAVGVVRKPVEAEEQRVNAGVPLAVTMLRVRGGTWRFVLTPEQYVTLWQRHWDPR